MASNCDEGVGNLLAREGIKWQFDLSRAPWWGGGAIRENDWSCQAVPVLNHWKWVFNIDRATRRDIRRRSDPQQPPPKLCRGRLTVPHPNPKFLFVRRFKPSCQSWNLIEWNPRPSKASQTPSTLQGSCMT